MIYIFKAMTNIFLKTKKKFFLQLMQNFKIDQIF